MVQEMDAAVEGLLQVTIQLEQKVLQIDSDPEEWLLLLDEREALIQKVDRMIFAGLALSARHRSLLSQIHEINQRLLPQMEERKQAVQKKLTEIQRSRTAVNTYHEPGPNAFGAFFDSKK